MYNLPSSFHKQRLGLTGLDSSIDLSYDVNKAWQDYYSIKNWQGKSLPNLQEELLPSKTTNFLDLKKSTKLYGSNPMSEKTKKTLSTIGSALGGLSGNDISATSKGIREGIRGFVGMLGPWGAGISAATGALDTLGDIANLNLSELNPNTAKRAGLKGAATVNEIVNAIPGLGTIIGAFGKKTNDFNISSDAISAIPSYSGSFQTMMDAEELSGKRVLNAKKFNSFINTADALNKALTDMAFENKKYQSNYAPQILATNYAMNHQGYTPGLTLHKYGGTIPELEEVRSIMQSLQSKKQEIQEPQKFQLGGKMNMIVTGALHARKHNLEELNPNLEGEITKKGIPVVTFEEGGEVGQQLAEVESQELVLQIDTTKTIEDYYDEYNSTDSKTEKNKIALECGKYLVDELLKNTDDPDKLIKQVI